MIFVKTTLVDLFGLDSGGELERGEELERARDGRPNGLFRAELDSRPTGLNNGLTSFFPGEKPYILLYRASFVELVSTIFSMDGLSLHRVADQEVEITQSLRFEESSTATLSAPFVSEVSAVWMGRSLGNLAVSDASTITAVSSGTAICLYTYKSVAQAYRLEGVPQSVNGLTEFDILVSFYGRVVE